MKNDKKIRAEYLLTEIGEIDDALLAEAAAYRGKRTRRYRPLLVAAAVLLVIFTVMTSSLIAQFRSFDKEEALPESDNDINADGSPSEIQALSLEVLFTQRIDRDDYSFVTGPSALPYFDEYAHIVWKYADDDRYFVSADIKQGDLLTIQEQLGRGRGVGYTSPKLDCTVWVLFGDGRVASPYLIANPGNASSSVFDYEAEIYPERVLIEKILSILSS